MGAYSTDPSHTPSDGPFRYRLSKGVAVLKNHRVILRLPMLFAILLKAAIKVSELFA